MTEEDLAVKIAEQAAAKAEEIKERKANEIKAGFLDPFGECTSYKEFLKEVAKAKSTVAEYCKGKITDEQLQWLEKELSLIKEEK